MVKLNKSTEGVLKMFKKFILVFVLVLSFSNVSFAEGKQDLIILGENNGIYYYAMKDNIKVYEDRINVVLLIKDTNKNLITMCGDIIWDKEYKYQIVKVVVLDMQGNVVDKSEYPLPINSYEKGTIFDNLAKFIRNGYK